MDTSTIPLRLINLDHLWIALAFFLFTLSASTIAQRLRSRLATLAAVAFAYCTLAQLIRFGLDFVPDSRSLSYGFVLVGMARVWPAIFLIAAVVSVVLSLRAAQQEQEPSARVIATGVSNGHFYSPIVDPKEAEANQHTLWPTPVRPVDGIDFNAAFHLHVLEELFPRYIAEFDYEETGKPDEELSKFYIGNPSFGWLDARTLFVLLRAWRPKRVIEVGAGYSTLLMSDVSSRFADSRIEIHAIEPYPRAFLNRLPCVSLIEKRVQDVAQEEFDQLEAGDILFIDSSHVSKTGSDVNYLCFEILPRLRSGVRVHFHDILLPAEYLKHWVIDENRSWNEQYLVRALLMFSTRFRVLFGSSNAFLSHRGALAKALGMPVNEVWGGGSLWLEVI